MPFELVDAVLGETRAVGARLRDLPSRVGVYFLLAMCLFPEVGYRLVWDKMVCALGGLTPVTPTAKALRDLRRRVGVAPMHALFEVLAGPLAQPRTPGVRFGGYRLVSFDGCSSQKVPDTSKNRAWLGWSRAGYPMLELMTLVETGTRSIIGAVFGRTAEGETSYARRLLGLLTPQMLVLWDRGFDANDFLAEVCATGAQVLGRIKNNRRLPITARLCDGSYRSRIGAVDVRIIDAHITVTCADGTTFTGYYRLVTTLADHRRYPAARLITLYHQRWEHESAYYALRHTLLGGRVLRSGDPAGVAQEMWSLLTLYQLLRTVMVDAAESRPGTDPDRVSFTIALHTARDQLISAAGVIGETIDLLGTIGTRLLDGLLDARRLRVSTRKVKSSTSRYHTRQNDGRPTTSTNVTALDIAVYEPPTATPAPPQHKPHPLPRYRPPSGLPARILNLIRTQPHRHWHTREIAAHLAIPNNNSLRARLWKMVHLRGQLHQTRPATYTLNTQIPCPP